MRPIHIPSYNRGENGYADNERLGEGEREGQTEVEIGGRYEGNENEGKIGRETVKETDIYTEIKSENDGPLQVYI